MAAKKKKITAQEAAVAAAGYYKGLAPHTNSKLAVAETDLSPSGSYWLITLSITDMVTSPLTMYGGVKAEYRIFEVNVNSGEVVSMKIKKFE